MTIKWLARNKRYYESLGYNYTHINDDLIVKLYDLMKDSAERVVVHCDDCNKEIITPYRNYNRIIEKSGAYRCRKCNAPFVSKIRIENKKEEALKKFNNYINSLGYKSLADTDDYNGQESKMPFMCPKHGLQYLSLEQVNQQCLCSECGKENKGECFRLSVEDIMKRIKDRTNGELTNPEDYIDIFSKNLYIRCGICGNIFITSYNNFRASTGYCLDCSKSISSGEQKVQKILEKHNIEFIRQKKFDDCKNINCLPFDFYLPNLNCCIEFQGKQHYVPVKFFGGEEGFRKRKKNDKIKKQYCIKNNIYLIEVPYYEYDNLDNFLFDKLIRRYSLVS